MSCSRVRAGVAGYGAIGRHHARVLRSFSDVEFVGIADPSAAARAAAGGAGFSTVESVDDLIAQGIEAAVVAVPTSQHRLVAEALIAAGCATLIEKPLAGSISEARCIVQAATASGTPLMVGYVERYNPALGALKEFLVRGDAGQLIAIQGRRAGPLPPSASVLDAILDIGVHDLDAVAWLTGEPLRLIAAQGGAALLTERFDHARIVVSAGLCIATLESNWVTPMKVREMTVTGTLGTCRLDYLKQALSFVRASDGAEIAFRLADGEPLLRQDRAFVDGVLGAPLPDPKIALESLRIAEEAALLIASNQTQLTPTA